MILLPAIDIKNGQCVRLKKGDFRTVEKVAEDWLATANGFREAGAEWIHMVDLDGALAGAPVNDKIFIEAAKKTGLSVEVGGGIRTMETIEYYLENGIRRVVLGSAALGDPDLIEKAAFRYGDRIAAGIDADGGMVKSAGWTVGHTVDYLYLAVRMESLGIRTIIFTDIAKDGMLSGPNLAQLSALQGAVSANIIASGGIKDLSDIEKLAENGLYGAICGKSLYQGTLDLKEAVEYCKTKK